MGKGKGKKSRKVANFDAKKDAQTPKIPGPPPLPKMPKVKKPKIEKSANTTPLGPTTPPVKLNIHNPFTKQTAKWPALFKKHIGVIEAHIRTLDRVMQSMQSNMGQMKESEKLDWELGERGNWRVICEMMDRARDTLACSRKAAAGILPAKHMKDKKGLGVIGTTYEALGPQLDKKAKELGYNGAGRGKLGRNPDEVDSDGDTIMSESESSSGSSSKDEDDKGDDLAEGADFVSLKSSKAVKTNGHADSESSSSDESDEPTNGVEPNPYFFIDTAPTPVVISGTAGQVKETKREKKIRLAAEREVKKEARKIIGQKRLAARIALGEAEAAGKPQPQIDFDFKAMERKLREEIAAGKKAQEVEAAEEATFRSASEEQSKKKRRRISDGTTEVVDRVKKIKMEESSTGTADDGHTVEKKEKKEKKRKAEHGDGEGGHKKKRRQEA